VWLAIHLAGWELHAAVSALDPDARSTLLQQPLAVVDADRRSTLLACNELAHSRGVRAGHSMNAAIALCADLRFLPRIAESELRELEKLARFCDRYSPVVSLEPPNELLLEIRGSIKLFGGIDALVQRIHADLMAEGVKPHLAVTPTPQSALWISRVVSTPAIVRPRQLRPTLSRLPVSTLLWPAQLQLRLSRFGVHTVGDLLRLPRAGLSRRVGHEALAQLDHAVGRFPQLREAHRVAQSYCDRVLLDFEIETTSLLGIIIEKRFACLDQHLRQRMLATDSICIAIKHREQPITLLPIGLASPTSDVAHIARLMHEQLRRLTLPAPVIELVIRVEHVLPQPQHTQALFKMQGQSVAYADTQPQARLLEQLYARLGSEAVRSLHARPDFRPERAQHAMQPQPKLDVCRDNVPSTLAPRPLWLLDPPRRLGAAQLKHLRPQGNAERIESGWWDGAAVNREYHVMRSIRGAQAWVFQNCDEASHYVQGLFG
jgi:protein ImuB